MVAQRFDLSHVYIIYNMIVIISMQSTRVPHFMQCMKYSVVYPHGNLLISYHDRKLPLRLCSSF